MLLPCCMAVVEKPIHPLMCMNRWMNPSPVLLPSACIWLIVWAGMPMIMSASCDPQVSKIYPVHASVQLGEHLPRARVHVSHILDFQAGLVPDAAESPMQNLSVGASVKVH